MIATRPARRPRTVLALLVAMLAFATCYGPSAAAGGNHAAPVPSMPPTEPGFTPPPTALMLKADRVRFVTLTSLTTNVPIQMSNGAMSPPDTIYVRAKRIELDNLSIGVDRGSYRVKITNSGAGSDTAAVGSGPDAVVEMWIQINALQLCVTPQLFQQLAINYAGVFGGALDEVLQMITDAFAPAVAGPLATVGPCVPAAPLIPLVGVFLKHGVPLPGDTLEAGAADIPVWAVKVHNPSGAASLGLPKAFLGVEQ